MSLEYNQLPAVSYSFPLLRLIEQYKNNERLIIAYDIDDTIRPYHSNACGEIESLIRMAKRVLNPYLIVYTSNEDIDGIKKFLNKYDIPYDAINENAPFVSYRGGKIYYNLFLDDKAGLAQAAHTLEELIHLVVNGYVEKEVI